MRGVFGLIGLVVTLALVGILVKKQIAAVSAPVPVLQGEAATATPGPTGTVREQSQQVQQQIKQQLDGLLQQPRPISEDEK